MSNIYFKNPLVDNATGLRYSKERGVEDNEIQRALQLLDHEELSLLLRLQQEEGVGVDFILPTHGVMGAWSQSEMRMRLAIYSPGKIKPGTIVHEAKHFQQYKEGRLAWARGECYLWKGERVENKKGGFAYFQLPWEQEAFRAEAEFLSRRGLRIPTVLRMWGWKAEYAINPFMDRMSEKLFFPLFFHIACQAILLGLTWPFSETLAGVVVTAFSASPIGVRIMMVQIDRVKEALGYTETPPLRGATPRKR
tara:strand:- start:10683 stop:11435 length:753 start_codon:yes stop_codon:yes gene_type:complete